MQPMAGTPPARDEAADTDGWTESRPASQDTACPDLEQGPHTARPRSPASARPGLSTALTTDSWFGLAGDMRLCRPRGTSPEFGPHLFRRVRRVVASTVHTDHLAGRTRSQQTPLRRSGRRRAVRRGGERSVPAGASRSGGQARHAGGERTGQASRRRTTHPRPRTTSTTNTRHARRHPHRVTAPALPHLHDLHHLPARPPLTAFPVLLLPLLILILDNLLLAAAPPPAQTATCLGCPQIYLAGRGRGVQREAVDPPSSKAQV